MVKPPECPAVRRHSGPLPPLWLRESAPGRAVEEAAEIGLVVLYTAKVQGQGHLERLGGSEPLYSGAQINSAGAAGQFSGEPIQISLLGPTASAAWRVLEATDPGRQDRSAPTPVPLASAAIETDGGSAKERGYGHCWPPEDEHWKTPKLQGPRTEAGRVDRSSTFASTPGRVASRPPVALDIQHYHREVLTRITRARTRQRGRRLQRL